MTFCKPIVFVDVETTGLFQWRGDRVVEVAAVRINASGACDEFVSLVDCGVEISKEAQRLNGITRSMLIDQPSPRDVFSMFRKFVGDAPLVSHNASFDREFLQREFSLQGWCLNNKFECFLKLSRDRLPGLENYKLRTVARRVIGEDNLRAFNAHRALDDARLLARLWQLLIPNE